MNFVFYAVLFVGALITYMICIPLFNQVIGMLPFSGAVVIFANVLVLMLIVCIFYVFVKQNMLSYQQGGVTR